VHQRLASLLPRPIAFAHRGARAYAPENTIESFGLALQQGATGLESDVWLTSDGVPVLDHDGLVRRTFAKGRPIAGVTRAQLPAHIPALTDLLGVCGTFLDLGILPGAEGTDVVREVPSPARLRLVRVGSRCCPLRGNGLASSTAPASSAQGRP
jgi:glycerophosphoryl diester phosphodiesterase